MNSIVLVMFLAIGVLFVASIVIVVCLIIKESKKNSNVPVNNMIPMENVNNQSVVNKAITSTDRITDSDINYLKKLKDLKDKGVLSKEEYNAERNKVLAE